MAKRKEITVGKGLVVTLQSVSPSWYFDLTTECRDSDGNIDTRRYMDELFKNCVVAPAEIRNEGLTFFDKRHDRHTAIELRKAIDRFLDEPAEYGGSQSESTEQ